MLKTLRIIAALFSFTFITLLFLDFSGTLHQWFGWLAKIQLVPAILALNAGVIFFLFIIAFLFGRLYCSVVCPLGIFQDAVSWIAGKIKKNRFNFSAALSKLRYVMLFIFILSLIGGAGFIANLIEPYSAYGRIISTLFAPLYGWINNILAYFAERADSYAFYSVDVWIKNWIVMAVAIITVIIVSILAWRHGRTYCNTICPVGTFLGLISKYSLYAPVIDTSKCNNCGLCGKNCKSSCINTKEHSIDYSRCVVCMDCINKCKESAITFTRRPSKYYVAPDAQLKHTDTNKVDSGKRNFLSVSALLATTIAIKAQENKVDGGLAIIKDKKSRSGMPRITPPGSLSVKNLTNHCTACQLCISACPNKVLVPSSAIESFMQPEMKFDKGYCRPECTECSSVCPTGAIRPITTAQKSAIQIGHAVWVASDCIAFKDKVKCGNCERHCPTGAIHMVHPDGTDNSDILVPAVNIEKCIGCGSCENLCPVRPLSAIYVTGHERHRNI